MAGKRTISRRPAHKPPETTRWVKVAVTVVLIVLVLGIVGVLLTAIARGETPSLPACPALASPTDPVLNGFATEAAQRQATAGRQSHDGFSRRVAKLAPLFPGRTFAEICAESWPWHKNEPPEKLWAEFAKCWRQSPGHWSVASRKHWKTGTGIAQGRNGVWYGVILTCD